MTYVVDEKCIKCKTTDCVAVCPVNCFYEGENMLVIHPDECIDCGVCEPECPVDAIKPDTEPGLEKWLELNREYAQKWPNITGKKDMPKDARTYWDETEKFDKYFSPKPGEVPAFATAPALVFVGCLMMAGTKDIAFDDPTEYVPAAVTIIAMPMLFHRRRHRLRPHRLRRGQAPGRPLGRIADRRRRAGGLVYSKVCTALRLDTAQPPGRLLQINHTGGPANADGF